MNFFKRLFRKKKPEPYVHPLAGRETIVYMDIAGDIGLVVTHYDKHFEGEVYKP